MNTDLSQDLLRAVCEWDIDDAKKLVEMGADFSAVVTENIGHIEEDWDAFCFVCSRWAHVSTSGEMLKVLCQSPFAEKTLYKITENTSILGRASALCSTENLKILLDLGIDPNAHEHQDVIPPLHVAVNHGRLEHVQLLLSHGANSNAKDSSGQTAFYYLDAFTPNTKNTIKILELLLNSGDDLSLKDHNGVTAADYIQKNKHELNHLVVEYLQKYQKSTKLKDTLQKTLPIKTGRAGAKM